MRFAVLLTAFACALAAATAPAYAQPAAAATGKGGSPAAALQECSTGPAADQRVAVFVGRMKAMPGAQRLQLRFILQMRGSERGRWARIEGQPLGSWSSADPGVRGYVFTKRVERLAAPGAYRVLVQFRWLSGEGEVVHSARRTSPVCKQPDFRPNLRPRGVEATRSAEGRIRYRVLVGNDGGASAPFELALRVGEQLLASVLVPGADAAGTTTVELEGPPCPAGGSLDVVVDPASTVPEQREGDNALRLPCPPGAVAPSLY